MDLISYILNKNAIAKVEVDVEEVKEDLSKAEQDIVDIKEDIVDIKEDITQDEQDISNIKQDIVDIKEDIDVAEQDISDIKGDISTIQGDITDIKEDIGQDEQDISDIKGNITTIQNDISDINTELAKKVDEDDLGTSAYLDVPEEGHDAAVGEVVVGSDSRLTDSRNPNPHTHTLANITDAGSAAAYDIPVMGDALADEVVMGDDSRLTDTRDPNPHTHDLSDITDAGTAASKNVAASGDASTTEVVMGNDSRLTDNRDPNPHSHEVADITDFPSLGTASAKNVPSSGDAGNDEVVLGNDSRLSDARPSSDVTDIYSSSGTVPVSGKAVASAIGELDVTGASNIDASKTISAWSETDGKVSISTQDISITKSQVSDFPTLGTAAGKDTTDTYSSTGTDPVTGKAVAAALGTLDVSSVGGNNKYISEISEIDGKISATAGTIDATVTKNSNNLVTSGAVWAAIDDLPEPMVFRGSLGSGGTISVLPMDGSATVGDTYKVITDGTYAGITAKVGDMFTCLTRTSSANTWEYFPSGDEPSGTVISVKIEASSPIVVDDDSAITTSGTRVLSHANSGVTAGTYTSVTVDAKGHVTNGNNPDISYNNLVDKPTLGTAAALDVASSGDASNSQVVKGNDSRLTDARPSSDVTDTYSASGTVPVSGKAVASAIGGLDVTGDSSIGAGKTIKSWSETDGKVSITTQDISIANTQVSGLGTASTKDTTDTYSATGTNPTTGKAVAAALGTLDVTGASNIGASKTISAWSETDGKVSISTQDIAIANTQVSGLGTAATKNTTDTYSSTGTDPTTGKAVAAALGTLDVTGASGIAASKTIKAWSETDGKVSITTQDISITKSQVSDFPTLGTAAAKDVPASGNASTSQVVMGNDTRLTDSRNAKDVYSWAKASTKPSYTASEVGALADTTKYAGSSSVGGAATSAAKLTNTSKIGDTNKPVYFSADGVPVAISYTIEKSVPLNAVFTDNNTTYSMTRDGESVKLTPSSGTAQSISLSSLINGLGEGASPAEADDYLVAQYAGGGTTTTSYHRRKVSNVVNAARVKAALGTGSGTSKYLREDGTWVTPTDTNTTYTLATGDANGQIKVTPSSGSAYNVSVKGLGSAAYTNEDTIAPYEAYLRWGGRNFTGSYGPIDAALMDELGANRFQFIKASAITVEYSRDGGSTWTDYGASDAEKMKIFAQGGSLGIGKNDSSNKATTNPGKYMLRITIDTGAASIYTVLNKIVVYVNTNGSANCYCKIQKALQSTPTTFVDHTSNVSITGWSGYNVINISGLTTYGNTAGSQYGRVRFIFGDGSGGSTSYNGLQILQIKGFGGVGWNTPSTMAKSSHLYSYDQDQNVTFPAKATIIGELINQKEGIWVQGGSAAGGNYYRLVTVNGMPEGMGYNQGKRGTRLYSNGIAFLDPYNGNNNNDSAWIRHIEETANNGTLEIAVGDDAANEVVAVRRYNTSNNIANEILLFDASGNTSFPGTVTATKFSGALEGNAATATKATKDSDGNTINSTYLKLSGGTLTGDLKVGNPASTSVFPANGIVVHDTRGIAHTPGSITQKGVNFFFSNNTMPSSDWYAGMHVHGWSSSYVAWELVGPATTGDKSTSPLYVRTSNGTTSWGSWRKIYDTSNKPSKSDVGLGNVDNTADANKSVNYATSAGSAATASAVAWSGITGKPIELGTNSGALNTNGWKTLGGRSSGSKIYISYASSSPANWNSEAYSASIVFGCQDTKGLIDCGYNSSIVTFGGGSVNGSTDNNPSWYFKLSGTSGKTYTLPSDTTTLLSTTGSIANCTGLTKSQVTTALGYTPPTTDHTYNFSGTTFYSGNQNNAEHNANNALANGHYYYTSNGPSGLGEQSTDGSLYVQSYSDSWVSQIAQDYRNGRLFVRSKNNGTWQSWKRIMQTDEYVTAGQLSGSTLGTKATAEGGNVVASGSYSHAEGGNTTAYGDYSHAEGGLTFAYGKYSHAEGSYTTAFKVNSHAEGFNTCAAGPNSHVEGQNTCTIGDSSHAEGYQTCAQGNGSHAEGYSSTNTRNIVASGAGAHAEGTIVCINNVYEGNIIASGEGSHAEGGSTTASGTVSHAEGGLTIASGNYSHAEGWKTTAKGGHAEGFLTYASGNYSHAEGNKTTAYGSYTHAEGYQTSAYSECHAEGYQTTCQGNRGAHTEGGYTQVLGTNMYSGHAEGYYTTVSGDYGAHAGGQYTCAAGSSQTVIGKYNIPNTTDAFIIGGGSGTGTNRKNIFNVTWDGDAYANGSQLVTQSYLNSNFARYYKAGTTANTNGWKNGNNSVTITVTGVYLVIAWANFSGSSNMVQGINIHVGNYTYNQNIINMNYNQNITLSTTWIGSINANQSIYSQVYTGASQSNNTWIAAIRMS